MTWAWTGRCNFSCRARPCATSCGRRISSGASARSSRMAATTPVAARPCSILIARFELHDAFNLWVGRMLVPADRSGLSTEWSIAPWLLPRPVLGRGQTSGPAAGPPRPQRRGDPVGPAWRWHLQVLPGCVQPRRSHPEPALFGPPQPQPAQSRARLPQCQHLLRQQGRPGLWRWVFSTSTTARRRWTSSPISRWCLGRLHRAEFRPVLREEPGCLPA